MSTDWGEVSYGGSFPTGPTITHIVIVESGLLSPKYYRPDRGWDEAVTKEIW